MSTTMKDPGKIIAQSQGLGITGLLLAMAIPAALIVSTMFYSVDQLNIAGEREAKLSDSLNMYRAMAPAAVISFDTILQRDTVQIAGRDTVIQKDTVISTVKIPSETHNTLVGVWPDSITQLASHTDREALIKVALRRYPGYRTMEKELRAKGYFRLAGARSEASSSSEGTSSRENAVRERSRMMITSSKTNPVFIVLNPLKS